MKKLIILIFAVSLAASAGPVYKLKDGEYKNAFPVLAETVQFTGDYRVYNKTTSLNYFATDSQNRKLPSFHGIDDQGTTYYDVAHVYFTANETLHLGAWYDIDGKATPGEAHIDLSLSVSDYGIYFLDEDVNEVHNYLSLTEHGVDVVKDRAFGFYYVEGNNTINTTENWVASYDGAKDLNHIVTDPTWYENEDFTTRSSFMCLFQGTFDNFPTKLEWDHVEFGFVIGEEPEPPSGQPLPGVMMSALIGLGTILYKNKRK